MDKGYAPFTDNRRFAWLVFVFATALSLLLAACGGAAAPTSSSSTQQSGSSAPMPAGKAKDSGTSQTTAANSLITVNINEKQGAMGDEYWFEPASLDILPGTTVVWSNMTDEAHILMSSQMDALPSNAEVMKNGTLKTTFSTIGQISYFSKNRPNAKGTIRVQSSPNVAVQLTEVQSSKGDAYTLTPGGLVIKAGTSVEWTNMSDEDQPFVSSNAGAFDNKSTLMKNGTLKMTFSTPGVFAYSSKTRPDAKGIIVVVS